MGDRGAIRHRVAIEYRPLAGRHLEGLLASDNMIDTSVGNGFIHGEPILKGTPALLPIIAARLDFSQDSPKAQLRVGLFDLDVDPSNPRAIGWRFETPSSEAGMHDYHHAQPIKALLAGGALPGDQWYNETQPAFLLDAQSPATLIVAMLITLYGMDYVAVNLLKSDFRNEVQSVLNAMPSVARSAQRRRGN